MAGFGKKLGGMLSGSLGKDGAVDDAVATGGRQSADAEPADVERFRDAMKADATESHDGRGRLRPEVDEPEAESQATYRRRNEADAEGALSSPVFPQPAHRGEDSERSLQARRNAEALSLHDSQRHAENLHRRDDDKDEPHQADDQIQQESHQIAEDATRSAEAAAPGKAGGSGGTHDHPATPSQAAGAMTQAASAAPQRASLADGAPAVRAATGNAIEALQGRHGWRGSTGDLDDDRDRDRTAGAAPEPTTVGGFTQDAAVATPQAPKLHSAELAELAEKLVDQMKVSIPEAPGAALTLTLSPDVLQGAEITIQRDEDGLSVSIRTPSPDIFDRINPERGQLARLLGDRLNERVQVTLVGPAATQRAAGATRLRSRRELEHDDDDDR